MMSVKTSWPWITMLLAVAVAVNPVGLDFLRGAFLSNEQLSRNIAGLIVLMVTLVLAALVLLEFGIRTYVVRKRRTTHGAWHG